MNNNHSSVTVKILSRDKKIRKVLVEIPGNYPTFSFPSFQQYKRPLTKWAPDHVQFWMAYPPLDFRRIVQVLRDGGYPVSRFEWATRKAADQPDLSEVSDV
jgi:hypothetical protein